MPVTNSGQLYAFGVQPGMDAQDFLSNPQGLLQPGSYSGERATTYAAATAEDQPNYLWYLLGIFILLVIAKIASEHEKSGMEPAFIGIGLFNFFVVGITAMLFLLLGKVIVNKWYLKGMTELFNAV